jgi:uncharacterized protein
VTQHPHEPSIPRRDIVFDVAGAANPDWLDGDPLRSAYCDALSVFFPIGERFFISAVQSQLASIEDLTLKQQVRDFCAQEAMHTREHEAYNAMLRSLGYDVDAMEARASDVLAGIRSTTSRLTVTAAIEHLTATLAHLVISNPKLLAQCPAAYRNLWTWHCLEELEHKGVAFDVFLGFTASLPAWKRYSLRCIGMVNVTWILHSILLANVTDILRSRGISIRFRTVAHAMWLFFGMPGVYRRALGYYLKFFLPGFHPWNCRDSFAVAAWREYFDRCSDERVRG